MKLRGDVFVLSTVYRIYYTSEKATIFIFIPIYRFNRQP